MDPVITPTAITQLISAVWAAYVPVILPVAAILVGAAVGIYLSIRFAPAMAKKLFKG